MGVSEWAEQLQITLPQPSPPDRPVLFADGERMVGEEAELELTGNSTTVELSWDRPDDNGAVIDYYRLEVVSLETNSTNVTLVSGEGRRVARLGRVN